MEGMAAVALLAFIGASAWVVMDRCMMSAADSTQRMRAFEIARENMEKLLGSASVTESAEYGVSEKFPDIRWQTAVETFYEPINSRIWVQAVCSAEYSDSAGESRTIELTHWLTELTKEQVQELMRRMEIKQQMLAEQTIETEDLAAEYAGVSVETIRQWVQNGMPVTEVGEYLKPWLDLYLEKDGSPTEQDKQDVMSKYPELPAVTQEKTGSDLLEADKILPDDIDINQLPGS